MAPGPDQRLVERGADTFAAPCFRHIRCLLIRRVSCGWFRGRRPARPPAGPMVPPLTDLRFFCPAPWRRELVERDRPAVRGAAMDIMPSHAGAPAEPESL